MALDWVLRISATAVVAVGAAEERRERDVVMLDLELVLLLSLLSLDPPQEA